MKLKSSGRTGFTPHRPPKKEVPFALAPVVSHVGIKCGSCDADPIVGVRYHCAVCPDVDLCERCEGSHDPSHALVKIRQPASVSADHLEAIHAKLSPAKAKGKGTPTKAKPAAKPPVVATAKRRATAKAAAAAARSKKIAAARK
mmetsp:Transcript_57070/g.134330  ORF Transcript_57070/g.134330 Transcript_57070/m.134330 type:complete len:144 (+) Transcript_57070:1-432(+)